MNITAAQKNACLNWFSGKGRTNAADALDMLTSSLENGYWIKGASRRVRAALSKQNLAQRWGMTQERPLEAYWRLSGRVQDGEKNVVAFSGVLDDIMDNRLHWHESEIRGYRVRSDVQNGTFQRARQNLAFIQDMLAPLANNEAERAALEKASEWCRDWIPVQDTVEYLDSLRPPAVFTSLGVSPTITATIVEHGLDPKTVRMPPIKRELVEKIDKDGKVIRYYVYTIEWPEGTVHGAMRWVSSKAKHEQCHACGHAIKNVFNWVPLLVDANKDPLNGTYAGKPHSMWVGGDCAHSLFGIKKDGDAEWKNTEGR